MVQMSAAAHLNRLASFDPIKPELRSFRSHRDNDEWSPIYAPHLCHLFDKLFKTILIYFRAGELFPGGHRQRMWLWVNDIGLADIFKRASICIDVGKETLGITNIILLRVAEEERKL